MQSHFIVNEANAFSSQKGKGITPKPPNLKDKQPFFKTHSAKRKRRLSAAAVYGVLGVLSFLWLVPLVFLVVKSFSKEGGTHVSLLSASEWTVENYRRLFTQTQFGRWYANTLIIAVCSCLITTAFVLSVSFAFSRLRFKGRRPLMNVMLVLGMFPGFMSMAAIYAILKVILPSNYQSSISLILVYSGGAALSYYVAKGFFDTVPRQIDEAARIDGANEWQLFSRIILPLSRSVIVYTVLTSFIAPWCDFIFSSYILKGVPDTGRYTVALGLYNLISADKSLLYTNFPVFCAGAVVVAVPITLLFFWLQKYYVAGVTGGAVKG